MLLSSTVITTEAPVIRANGILGNFPPVNLREVCWRGRRGWEGRVEINTPSPTSQHREPAVVQRVGVRLTLVRMQKKLK